MSIFYTVAFWILVVVVVVLCFCVAALCDTDSVQDTVNRHLFLSIEMLAKDVDQSKKRIDMRAKKRYNVIKGR